MRKTIFLLLSFLLLAVSATAQSQIISGYVTCNRKGVVNVVVSDGYRCVATDKNGRYSLPLSDKNIGFVFISTPSGYLAPDSLNVPIFHQKISGEKLEYNFELIKNRVDDTQHLLLVHADPQFFKIENFERYKEVVSDCMNTIGKYNKMDIFGIDCGDLVSDKPNLYNRYIEELNKVGIPFYRVLGNHDLTYGGTTTESSTTTYNNYFGPASYSFNRGNVHYVILNNVFYLGRDYFYMGYLDEKTLHWLQEDLSFVPEGSTVFVAMHIPARLKETQQPFSYTSENIANQTVNISALFNLLQPYHAHILTGHMHTNSNAVHTSTLYEHNTGAICGAWWQGDYCLDGTPIGYGVYEINGDNVEWYFKSVGTPREYQFRLYDVGENMNFPDEITTNVWNWDKDWTVEWFENGVLRGEMTRCETTDPKVFEAYSDKDKLDFKWISPMKTNHMFRAKPQYKNSDIEVRVTDRFGNVYRQRLSKK